MKLKKLVFLIMILIMAICIVGCKKKKELSSETNQNQLEQDHSNDPLVTSDVNIDIVSFEDEENGEILNQASAELIILPERYVEKYPKLEESILAFNEFLKENAQKFVEENKVEIRQMREDRSDDTLVLSYQSTINIERIDDIVFSFSVNEESYTGGAHGSHYTIYHNFNPVDGKEFVSNDVFTNKTKLKEAIISNIEESYGEQDLFEDWKDTLETHFKENKELNFVIGKNFVSIIFDYYYLGPYSTGAIECIFLYEDYKDFINKKYFK